MNKLQFAFTRRWPILVVGLLIGAVLGALTAGGASDETDVTWTGSEIVFLDLTKGTSIGVVSVAQGAEQITRGEVPARAAETLGYRGDPTKLAQSVEVTPLVDSLAIRITATDSDPQRAVDITSAFAKAFIDVTTEKDLALKKSAATEAETTVAQAKAELDQFDALHPEVREGGTGVVQALVTQRLQFDRAYRDAVSKLNDANAAIERSGVYYSQGAEQPQRVDDLKLAFPSSLPLRTATLAFITFFMAVVLALVLERLSPRLDTRESVIDALGLPVIGEVGVLPKRHRQGKERRRVTMDLPSAEAYRRVRSTFQFVQHRNATGVNGVRAKTAAPGVFMIVSASPAEGKSTTVAMTALSMAEAGERTLVLGCDYRRPVIDILLGIPRGQGVTARAEMSMERPELEDIVYKAEEDNLWVAPAGRPTQNVVGCADVARELIAVARESGLSVIIDTTPILVANDVVDLMDAVDEVVLVVRAGYTTVKSARQAVEQIKLHGGDLLGVILVASPTLSRMSAYYADYYYEPEAPPIPPTDPPVGEPVFLATPDPDRDRAAGPSNAQTTAPTAPTPSPPSGVAARGGTANGLPSTS